MLSDLIYASAPNPATHVMNMAKNIVSGKHIRILYDILVHPYLSYGNLLWGNSYKKYINTLEILQKKAICCMCKANIMNIHRHYLSETKSLNLKIYIAHNLANLYTRKSEIHQHDTRHNIDIHLPKVNFDIVRKRKLHIY